MEEGEDNTVSTISTLDSRPQTARRESDEDHEQFTFHNVHDLISNQEQADDSISIDSHGFNQSNQFIDPANLPALPTPNDSSLLYHHSDNEDDRSEGLMMDERAMQRHLDNVESSFLPAVSPIGGHGKRGADDSYLFDAHRNARESSPPKETQTPKKSIGSGEDEDYGSPPTPDEAYKTPGPAQNRYSSNVEEDASEHSEEDTTSALETLSSSPTAAAAARTISRAMSMASMNYETASQSREDTDEDDLETTPTRSSHNMRAFVQSTDDYSNSSLRNESSNRSLNHLTVDAGTTPGFSLPSNNKRPKFLRSRHSSQRSSVSSFITNPEHHDDRSDATLGADYALQSGGAVPTRGLSRSGSMTLSRTMSLGSMASGIDENMDSTGRVEGPLATLAEEDVNRGDRKSDQTISAPETPRVQSRPIDAPTDTAIARHVRNVHVPESIAKELRNKNPIHSPSKSANFAASALGPRNAKNLTLKEQSSTIERLSKENFDLKLKVMFLSDRLDKLSEEGVKEMISENVELKTGLAVMQRDNKALKRKVKDLEKRLKDDEDRPSTAKSGTSTEASPRWFQEGAFEREEELLYLREKVEEYITEIEKLRNEGLARENEKRNLTELVRSMGERQGQNIENREEMDVWKDLLEQETSRREQSDDENKRLREEIFRLKSEATTGSGSGHGYTTNFYNINKKPQNSPSRPQSELSDRTVDRNGTYSSAGTLVEEYRRDNEQLRHENAELRREVGAQTSMLTSRNREKERLYQEIEDLKLGQRRGTSVAGESIFERSASRAHERSLSRTSAGTRQSSMTDVEREDFENKQAELRDRMNSLKIHNQDLQRELESCMEDFETAVEHKKEAEALAQELQEALDIAENDLVTMQTDRDEALQGQEEAELMFESLRKEAQEELDGFAAEAEEATAEIERLQSELTDTTDNFRALQIEMREMGESVIKLEDDHEQKIRRIDELERDLDEANRELEEIEKNYVEANEKVNRLNVQQESSQNEIAFLREEQDGDKIKIGDLEAAIRNLEQSLHEEQERARELDERLAEERHQRELVADREKEEVQQFVNDLNREASTAKDENRKLRKNLTSREVEAAEWKQRLMELENNLREALGDLNGTRSSLLNSIAKLQRELENTIRDLDSTKTSLAEKERMIKQRDALLESHALESRKLADMLDKERQGHRVTKHQYETFQKTNSHTTRTLSQQESRVLELETSRQQDRRKIATLENNFKEQLTERNNLLLAMWNRLAALCGTDWTHNNSLINGRALPSLEAVSTMLPGFSKNLLAAVKTLETLVGDFRGRVKDLDRRLWKEYQNLENRFEMQTKKLDRLDTLARNAVPLDSMNSRAEVVKLKDLNRSLKTEISTLRAANEVRAGVYETRTSPSPSVPTGPRRRIDNNRSSTLSRNSSASTVETVVARAESARSGALTRPSDGLGDDEYKPDLRWQVRLQELEYKLKAEREARKLDRNSAAQRLREKDRENTELMAEIEREKVRAEMGR